MQVSVEELGALERQMTVQVPAEKVDKEVQNRLVSMSRKARIDGFRPGKVPVKIVKRMYGAQVRQEVLNEVVQNSLQDAITQEKLNPAGMPKIEPLHIEEGLNLEYKATFEVFPEFEPQGVDDLNITRPVADVADTDIDKMLQTLREQKTTWTAVDRTAQNKDRVTISFEGKLDGEDFQGNKGEDVPLVLGSGAMIPGFEDNLLDNRAGDNIEFDITFPEQYPAENLAGKVVHFTVQINEVAEALLPEIDDEFAQGFGISGGSEALKDALKENMQRELEEKVKGNIKQQIWDHLLATNDFPVPKALVDSEIENLAKQMNYPGNADENTDDSETKAKLFTEEAQRRVSLGLLIAQLSTKHDIEVDDERVQQQLEKMASSYEDSVGFIQWYRQNPQAMQSIHTLVLEDQVVDFLLEKANVTDKSFEFNELMDPKPATDEAAKE